MNSKFKNYEGLIIASDWDEKGMIKGLNLLNSQEDEIPLHMDFKAKSLVKCCKERVLIKGRIQEGYLHISTFTTIKNASKRRAL